MSTRVRTRARSVVAPPHYQGRDGSQAIDHIEAVFGVAGHLPQAMAYVLRAPHKGARAKDLLKARWYVERWLAKGPARPHHRGPFVAASDVAAAFGLAEAERAALGAIMAVSLKPGRDGGARWAEEAIRHLDEAVVAARRQDRERRAARRSGPAQAAFVIGTTPAERPQRAAWLAHWKREGRADDVMAAERRRDPITVGSPWPPETADPEVHGVDGRWWIQAGTPEHEAWLAFWRAEGPHGARRALAQGDHTIVQRSRWPQVRQTEKGPQGEPRA